MKELFQPHAIASPTFFVLCGKLLVSEFKNSKGSSGVASPKFLGANGGKTV